MKSVKRRSAPTIFVDPAIFKSYDIRGTVPDQLNPDVARLIGRAFAVEIAAPKIAVGRDMRTHSSDLAEAFIDGLLETGCQVLDLGQVSTDAIYFAVGSLKCDGGAMITASHNPPEYNGFKLCRVNAEPLSGSDGLDRIQDTLDLDDFYVERGHGRRETINIIPAFVDHVMGFIEPAKLRPLRVVVDAGNGMAGVVLPTVFDRLPVELIPLYFEPDGTFPNHPANPIDPATLKTLIDTVKKKGADLGVAFDGDADRMFLVDETGKPLGGDIVTMLVAKSLLRKKPGATILYNLICSRAVPELIEREGGRPLRTPVGHSLIKPIMKKEGALFGGEHSGHFYFQDNWYADSGLIAMLMALEVLSEEKKPLSELVSTIDPYFRSGEINVRVRNIPKTLEKIVDKHPESRPDYTDGVTFAFEHWWFNARPSNTEPLLRLNIEADSAELLKEKTAALLAIAKGRRSASAK
ncbi:MAG: phosphomannomutase/phosphoglucomutase [Candidatus Zixiibacteriota bacterium]